MKFLKFTQPNLHEFSIGKIRICKHKTNGQPSLIPLERKHEATPTMKADVYLQLILIVNFIVNATT